MAGTCARGASSLMAAGLLFAGLLVGVPIVAQQVPAPELIHLDIKGLPAWPITALVKDRDGFLWIGTKNGLCRYDGIMDLYRATPEDSSSIQGNYIEDLLLDGEGRLWVACFGGVSVCDPGEHANARKPRFQRKVLFAKDERRSAYEAKELFLDKEGGIWLAAVGNGLAAYDPSSGAFREVKAVNAALQPEDKTAFTTGVLRDASGIAWTVDHLSVYRYDPRGGEVKRYMFDRPGFEEWRGVTLGHIKQDALDPEVLWLETWGAGLIRFHKHTGVFEQFTITEGGPVNLTNIVWESLPQADGRLLVGIDQELRWFDPNTRTFSSTFGTFQWKTGRFDASALELLQDEDGRTWVGTVEGLFMLPAVSTNLALWTGHVQLQCIATDHEGYWGVRQYDQRTLFKLGPSGEVLDSLPIPKADAERLEPLCILQARDHLVHVGTTDGLITYDPGTRTFRSERLTELPGMNGRSPSIHSMAETDDRAVWLANTGRGLARYRRLMGSSIWNRSLTTDSTSPRLMNSVVNIGGGLLAVTLQSQGVGVLDTRTMRLSMITTSHPGGGALGNVVSLVPIPNGRLYAVTLNDGIIELGHDQRSLQIKTTYVNEQDPANSFTEAAADTLGNIWIATNTGLVRFDLRSHTFEHIGPLDGLGMSGLASIIAGNSSQMLAWNTQCIRFNASTFARRAIVNGLYIRSVNVHAEQEDRRNEPRRTSLAPPAARSHLDHHQLCADRDAPRR
ncbi:MAG: hypothetical protein IPO17_12550 [Flavobacteriales bacterium]|nr:hypothetical protein [Flavobacteriales bacterium]